MNRSFTLPRRRFLQSAAFLAAAVTTPPLQARPRLEGFKPGQMKLGCVCWNFRGIMNGPPWNETIDLIGNMGFDGIELIAARPNDFETYWKKDSVLTGLKKQLDKYKLTVSQFALFQTAVEDLSNLDSSKRNRSLDCFEEGCKIAQKLGAPIINIVAPWARDLTGPSDYLPRYFAQLQGAPEKKFHLNIAEGFNYEKVWSTFVRTMKDACERASHYGLNFSLENHTHTLVHDSTAFLKLFGEVNNPILGMNMDIGWIQLQREYPPYAIHKVKDHLFNLHIRDIDGPGLVFVGIGDGVMDLQAVVDALKTVGYTGYLSFEQDGVPDMIQCMKNAKVLLEKMIGS